MLHCYPGADPGFVERGGAAAVPFEDPLCNFKRGGGRRGRAPSLALLEDPLWNFKRGGARPLRPPPNPLVITLYILILFAAVVQRGVL